MFVRVATIAAPAVTLQSRHAVAAAARACPASVCLSPTSSSLLASASLAKD
jgi:hypothetical protein